MRIRLDSSSLKEIEWHEYAVRFVLGGAITVVAGLIAREFGPVIGGLFLAFPAIFPASATVIEKHEKKKKEERGLHGTVRGRMAASVDAAGCAIGTIGLFMFALVVTTFLPHHSEWLVLSMATAAWLVASVSIWFVRKRL